MKLLLLMIPILLQWGEISSQLDLVFNQTTFDYEGNVQSVFIESFRPQFEDDSLIGLKHVGPSMAIHQRIYFDENGLIRSKDYLTRLRDIDSLIVKSVWTYHYSEGRLDSFFQKELDGESVKDGWKFYYSYGEGISYEYASKENEKSRRTIKGPASDTTVLFNIDSTISSTAITHYDKFHRKQRSENWDADGLESTTIYLYQDTMARVSIERYWMNLRSNEVIREVYEYNDHQDITRFTWYDSSGKQVNGSSFEYTYDDTGNWIEKKAFIPNGELMYVFKQTFEYQ